MNKTDDDDLNAVLKRLEGRVKSKPKEKNCAKEEAVNRKLQETISLAKSDFNSEIFEDLNWCRTKNDDIALSGCEFHRCDFSNSSMASLEAENCKFYDCNFRNANLKEAIFASCSFYNRDKEKGCNFYMANLVHSKFSKCDLSICIFEKADLFGIEMLDSRAQGASFKEANFTNIISRTVVFSSAYLKNSDFRYANFENCVLKKCDLSQSSFVNAGLFRTNLEEADLTGSNLTGIQLDSLQLAGADLRNAELQGLDIRRIDTTGVKICDWQQEVLLENMGIVVFPK